MPSGTFKSLGPESFLSAHQVGTQAGRGKGPFRSLGDVPVSASGARRVLTSCSAGASGMYDLAVTAGQAQLSET